MKSSRQLTDDQRISIALGLLELKRRGKIANVWIDRSGRGEVIQIARGSALFPIKKVITWRTALAMVKS